MKLTQKNYDGWSSGGNFNTGAGNSSNKMTKQNKLDLPIIETVEWPDDIVITDFVYWYKKFKRANKRIAKWRGLARYWKKEAQFQGAWADIFRDSMTKNMKLCNVANLKQKKAWIAFYIAIILYILSIMGIIILI